jgi:hypothetical protein
MLGVILTFFYVKKYLGVINKIFSRKILIVLWLIWYDLVNLRSFKTTRTTIKNLFLIRKIKDNFKKNILTRKHIGLTQVNLKNLQSWS